MNGIGDIKPSAGKKDLRVRFANITKDNLGQFRRMNMAIFPVRYGDKFYRDLLKGDDDNELIRLVYHSDMLVGAVVCRLEDAQGNVLENTKPIKGGAFSTLSLQKKAMKDTAPNDKKLYIMTLGVLKPYQGCGIGKKLLAHIVHFVRTSTAVNEIYLHVQVNNQGALDFYKRNGFEITGTIKGYYKKVEPADCYVVSRSFGEADRLRVDDTTEKEEKTDEKEEAKA